MRGIYVWFMSPDQNGCHVQYKVKKLQISTYCTVRFQFDLLALSLIFECYQHTHCNGLHDNGSVLYLVLHKRNRISILILY